MGKPRKTHEQFVSQLKEVNPNIIVVGQYISTYTHIDVECDICHYRWKPTPHNLLTRKSGCPNCSKHKIYTETEVIDKLKTINNSIIHVGTFINCHLPTDFKCTKCGYVWNTSFSSIFSRSTGCPRCANVIKKEHKQFVDRVLSINTSVSIIGEYDGMSNKILCKCNTCGNEWNADPRGLVKGCGCPQCKASKGELKISNWLRERNINFIKEYTFHDCVDARVLPFDFYLPDYNSVIEYDGIQHFFPFSHFGGKEKFDYQKNHDNIKTQYCIDSNIKLIRIPYTEYNNIESILKKELA